jgi:hypothetical protein
MQDTRQTSPGQIIPAEAMAVSKLRDTVLIASVMLAAFVLGWLGGSNFAPSSSPDVLKFNASPRTIDPDKQNVVGTPETGQRNTWEAATVTWHRWRPGVDSSGAVTSSP